jgi:hypothetical protein
MSKSDAEWADWARRNRVAFEISPLLEGRGNDRVQVGVGLTLYGALPMDKPAGPERHEAGVALMQELKGFIQEVVSPDPSVARTEWEPPRMAAVLRPENELKPEVSLTLRIFHADAYLKPVTNDEREHLSAATKRLTDKGLKQGRW